MYSYSQRPIPKIITQKSVTMIDLFSYILPLKRKLKSTILMAGSVVKGKGTTLLEILIKSF